MKQLAIAFLLSFLYLSATTQPTELFENRGFEQGPIDDCSQGNGPWHRYAMSPYALHRKASPLWTELDENGNIISVSACESNYSLIGYPCEDQAVYYEFDNHILVPGVDYTMKFKYIFDWDEPGQLFVYLSNELNNDCPECEVYEETNPDPNPPGHSAILTAIPIATSLPIYSQTLQPDHGWVNACQQVDFEFRVPNGTTYSQVLIYAALPPYHWPGGNEPENPYSGNHEYGIVFDDFSLLGDCDDTWTSDPGFTHDISDCVVNFEASEQGHGHLWDFGDGNISHNTNPSHQYAADGTYTVVHLVSNGCISHEYSEVITISNGICSVNLCETYGSNTPDFVFNTPGVLSGSFVNKNILITADQIVPANNTLLFLSSNIQMSFGVQITVEAGATFSVANGTNMFACDFMWKGVNLLSGARGYFTDCRIDDAQFAVQAQNGSELVISDMVFNDNFVGVYVPQGGVQQQGFGPFMGNRFHSSGSLKADYPGQTPATNGVAYAGVYLNDQAGFTIGINGVNSESNTFSSLANGIVTKNCVLDINSTRFINMKPVAAFGANDPFSPNPGQLIRNGNGVLSVGSVLDINGLSGAKTFVSNFNGAYGIRSSVNISNADFINVDNGVKWYVGNTKTLTLKNNDIKAKQYGVDASNTIVALGLTIWDNEVSMNQSGIAGLNFSNMDLFLQASIERNIIHTNGAHAGILMTNSKNTFISDNDIYVDNVSNKSFGIKGDGIENCYIGSDNYIRGTSAGSNKSAAIDISMSDNVTIYCNELENIAMGSRVQGANPGYDFRGNTFDTHSAGMRYSSSATAPVQRTKAINGLEHIVLPVQRI